MSIYFIDTSSLGKRYVKETGSEWLRSLITSNTDTLFIISELTLVESISMFEKYSRTGALSPSICGLLRYQFLQHSQNEYIVVPLNTRIMTTARKMIVKHSNHALRALDAMQLATAFHVKRVLPQTITFLASDKKLLSAAEVEDFPIDNPERHP